VSLLLLLTLVFGIIEFGHAFNVYQVMTNTAREGARFAVAPCPFASSIGSTCTAGQLPSISAVQSYAVGFLNSGSVYCPGGIGDVSCISVNPNYQPSTDPVNGVTLTYTQVTVSYPFTFYFFSYRPTITTDAVMRNETN